MTLARQPGGSAGGLARLTRKGAPSGLARRSDASVARLETDKALVEAIVIYRSSGYREVPPFNGERFAHHRFEKQLAASPSA